MTLQTFEQELSRDDLDALRSAVMALEKNSLAKQIAAIVGRRIGFAGRVVPTALHESATAAAAAALKTALQVAVASLDGRASSTAGRSLHRRLAMVSGAVGGAVGLASLPIELPISTTIMLRSIADIARREGEDLRNPESSLACLQVFALGGHAEEGNLLEGGYFAIRGLFAKSVTDAARYMAHRRVVDEAAPILIALIGQIARRFGISVAHKTVAQAVPLIGAATGAAVNLAFIEHFETLARGHFAVRRLERLYDPLLVRREYERIAVEAGLA